MVNLRSTNPVLQVCNAVSVDDQVLRKQVEFFCFHCCKIQL